MHDFVANSLCPTTEDTALVQGLRIGSPQAFETLLELYERPVYRFVYRLLTDPGEAPDVTQDVFVKVFRKIGEFRGDCSLKTWIYRIAVREASNRRRWFVRHRGREVSAETPPPGEFGGANWLVDHNGTPYDFMIRKELGRVSQTPLKVRTAGLSSSYATFSSAEAAATAVRPRIAAKVHRSW